MQNPETDNIRHSQVKPVSEFSLGGPPQAKDNNNNQQQYSRVKATDAANEISQVMQAAAKT